MRDSTRRNFLAVAGLGTAGGVAALATAGSASAAPAEDLSVPGDAPGSMAAHISDIRGSELTLLVQGHQVAIHDRALVARLARAYAAANRADGGR